MHQLFRWLPQIFLPGQIHLSPSGPTSFHTHFAVRQINNMPCDKRRSATNISSVSPCLLAIMFSFISSWGINDHQQFTHCTRRDVLLTSHPRCQQRGNMHGVESRVMSAALLLIPAFHQPAASHRVHLSHHQTCMRCFTRSFLYSHHHDFLYH